MTQYDSIVIGAGIAGASIAYALAQKSQKVLVIEKRAIASGGSGAAGAFVSPKIGLGSPLQTLTNQSFEFAKEFYLTHIRESFHQTGVVRIPKDKSDEENFFGSYEQYNQNSYSIYTKQTLKSLGIKSEFDSFHFDEAGACDSLEVCEFLLQNIDIVYTNIEDIYKKGNLWCVDKYRGANLILATGYESSLSDLRYMGIRGTWGSRGDFYTEYPLSVSMHQSLSIGANIDGVIKIGATHQKDIKEATPCKEEDITPLLDKASHLIDTEDLRLKELFCGMRAGSKDYFPLVGRVIDVEYMLKNHPKITKGAKPPLRHIDKLYILNGLGGRGFVFAPLMADMLSSLIVDDIEVDSRVNPDRLFLKWCRKYNTPIKTKNL